MEDPMKPAADFFGALTGASDVLQNSFDGNYEKAAAGALSLTSQVFDMLKKMKN